MLPVHNASKYIKELKDNLIKQLGLLIFWNVGSNVLPRLNSSHIIIFHKYVTIIYIHYNTLTDHFIGSHVHLLIHAVMQSANYGSRTTYKIMKIQDKNFSQCLHQISEWG